MVLEGIELVLSDRDILHLDDFGNFSLNGAFCEGKMPDENHQAESIEVNKVIFKAERLLKKRLSNVGFEKSEQYVILRKNINKSMNTIYFSYF